MPSTSFSPLDEANPYYLAMCMRAEVTETEPNGKSAKEPGSKLDGGKPQVLRFVLSYFPRACQAVAEVSAFGAIKYTEGGWRTVPDGIRRYSEALQRHLYKPVIEGPADPETGLLHAAHAAWNALAVLEKMIEDQEVRTGSSR